MDGARESEIERGLIDKAKQVLPGGTFGNFPSAPGFVFGIGAPGYFTLGKCTSKCDDSSKRFPFVSTTNACAFKFLFNVAELGI